MLCAPLQALEPYMGTGADRGVLQCACRVRGTEFRYAMKAPRCVNVSEGDGNQLSQLCSG